MATNKKNNNNMKASIAINNKTIKTIIIVGIIAIILGCFIPFEKEYIDADTGRHEDKKTTVFRNISKYGAYVSVPPSKDNYKANVEIVKREMIEFSEDGLCGEGKKCMTFYYFPSTKKLVSLGGIDDFSVSLVGNGMLTNIYEYTNMKCYIYGLFCPTYGDYSFREYITHAELKISEDAIVDEYSTTDDCTEEDKAKVSRDYDGDIVDCTKGFPYPKELRASSLFK